MPDVPDIQALLADSRWQDRFDDEILAAAQPLVGKVRNLRLEPASPDTLTLRGSVADAEPEVNAWQTGGGWDLETSCSCGLGGYCHHAAALLLKAARERDPARLAGRGVPLALPSARDLLKDPPPELPRVSFEPRFELHVTREPADRTMRMLLKSLGQAEPESWISATAV
ncbi:MAG: hypothetical protein RLZZ522_1178, partial [Verrucomicrobiota bacterium]